MSMMYCCQILKVQLRQNIDKIAIRIGNLSDKCYLLNCLQVQTCSKSGQMVYLSFRKIIEM